MGFNNSGTSASSSSEDSREQPDIEALREELRKRNIIQKIGDNFRLQKKRTDILPEKKKWYPGRELRVGETFVIDFTKVLSTEYNRYGLLEVTIRKDCNDSWEVLLHKEGLPEREYHVSKVLIRSSEHVARERARGTEAIYFLTVPPKETHGDNAESA